MKLIRQPNAWSCTVAALAMVTDSTIEEIIDYIGHDGSETLNSLPEPSCRKGFHQQELLDVALLMGHSMTVIEAEPVQLNSLEHEYEINKWGMFPSTEARFQFYLNMSPGLIVGKARKCWHTVAWDGDLVYDPNGHIYELHDCKINVQSFIMVSEI